MYQVKYEGFLQPIHDQIVRVFNTRFDAEYWCRAIGRKDLIPTINKIKG